MFKRFLDWWRDRKKLARQNDGQQLYIADLEYKMAGEQLQHARRELQYLRLELSENSDSHRLHLRLPDVEREVQKAESELRWRREVALDRRARFQRHWKVSATMYSWSAA